MHGGHDSAVTGVLHEKGEMYMCERGGRVAGLELCASPIPCNVTAYRRLGSGRLRSD